MLTDADPAAGRGHTGAATRALERLAPMVSPGWTLVSNLVVPSQVTWNPSNCAACREYRTWKSELKLAWRKYSRDHVRDRMRGEAWDPEAEAEAERDPNDEDLDSGVLVDSRGRWTVGLEGGRVVGRPDNTLLAPNFDDPRPVDLDLTDVSPEEVAALKELAERDPHELGLTDADWQKRRRREKVLALFDRFAPVINVRTLERERWPGAAGPWCGKDHSRPRKPKAPKKAARKSEERLPKRSRSTLVPSDWPFGTIVVQLRSGGRGYRVDAPRCLRLETVVMALERRPTSTGELKPVRGWRHVHPHWRKLRIPRILPTPVFCPLLEPKWEPAADHDRRTISTTTPRAERLAPQPAAPRPFETRGPHSSR